MKSNLVVLYHRMPYKEAMRNGKLVFLPNDKPNGIIPLLKSFFSLTDDAVWVAASELEEREELPASEKVPFFDQDGQCRVRRVFLSAEEIHAFYHRSCKEGFWPVLHAFPEKYNYGAVDWDNFESVNRRFAMAACEEVGEGGIIWIHDYNLWRAPYYIRKERPDAKVSFFFHTPFPPPDIFNILHWRQPIIESLMCCDLIGFDIPRYAENFANTVRSIAGVRVKKTEPVEKRFLSYGGALCEPVMTKELVFRDRIVRLDVTPEGTNHEYIKKIMWRPSFIQKKVEIEKVRKCCKLLFAPARVDYIKGTLELLQCYRRLLTRRLDVRENVLLFLVAVEPMDGIETYHGIHREIGQLIADINKNFSRGEWVPIIYSKRSLPFEEMVAWFSVSDILWIPSLRDGMNIICKEFIAVKEGSAGVLILSEFAGAAVELQEAVLTNPYSPESMDDSVDLALSMDVLEQQRRLGAMFARIMLSDIVNWSQQLASLKGEGLIC